MPEKVSPDWISQVCSNRSFQTVLLFLLFHIIIGKIHSLRLPRFQFFCFLCQISTTQKYSGHRTCLRTFQHMKRVTSYHVYTRIILLYEYRHHVSRLFTITLLSTLAQTNQPPRGVLLCTSKTTIYPQWIISNLNWCNTVNSVTLYFNMCFSRRDILFENCVTIQRFIRLSRQHVECKLMKRPRIDLSICHANFCVHFCLQESWRALIFHASCACGCHVYTSYMFVTVSHILFSTHMDVSMSAPPRCHKRCQLV